MFLCGSPKAEWLAGQRNWAESRVSTHPHQRLDRIAEIVPNFWLAFLVRVHILDRPALSAWKGLSVLKRVGAVRETGYIPFTSLRLSVSTHSIRFNSLSRTRKELKPSVAEVFCWRSPGARRVRNRTVSASRRLCADGVIPVWPAV